jgi:hypothetical protein
MAFMAAFRLYGSGIFRSFVTTLNGATRVQSRWLGYQILQNHLNGRGLGARLVIDEIARMEFQSGMARAMICYRSPS